MSERCEPPEELRGVDGWHWVQSTFGDPVIRRWLAGPHSAWRHLSMPSTPELAYQAGYRYLAPATPPAVVAALVEALEWFIDNDDTNEGDTPLPEHGGKTWNELNAYWLEGRNKAKAALAAYREAGR